MKKILIVLALLSIFILGGCNHHSSDWDRASCIMAGYEEPIKPDSHNIIKCKDKCGCVEVGVHYKQFELLREGYIKEVTPTYIKDKWDGWACEEKLPLQIEQVVACYKGCQFTTQPIYKITPMDNQTERINLYDNCILMCEDFYRD